MTSYRCSKCDFSRSIKGYVTQHIKKTTGCSGAELIEHIVKVQCEICNKEFDNEQLLKIHKKVCVEKKALVKFQFEDPDEMNRKIDVLTNLVMNINNKCERLEEENKDLKKRLEKLEAKHMDELMSENEDSLEEEEDDDAFCEHSKPHNFIPFTFENVVYNFNMFNCEDFDNVQMTVEGQRDIIMEGSVTKHYIEVGGVEYLYLPQSGDKKRGKKYTDELKIVLVNHCQNKKLKGKDYCAEHKHKLKN